MSGTEDVINDNEAKLADALASLNINNDSGNLLQNLSADEIQNIAQLALQLGEKKEGKSPDQDPAHSSTGIASSGAAQPPTPKTAMTPGLSQQPQTPAPPGSGLPWQENLNQVNNSPNITNPILPPVSGTPRPMAGIEELVRQHIAQNQQNLQQTQERQNTYTGPTMPEIRKDPATQSKVADIMAAIKAASPVFGQTPANPPPVQPQTPLEQLQQLILGQQHQSSATAHPLPSAPLQPQIHNHLDQLQQLLNQQPQNLGAGSLYTPQFTHQTFQPPVNQVQQLLQELSRTNLSTTNPYHPPVQNQLQQPGQDPLSLLLSALSPQQQVQMPPPPPTNPVISPFLLQQIQQNPGLLQQILLNPSLLQLFSSPAGLAAPQPAQGARHGLLQVQKTSQPPPAKSAQHPLQGMSHGRASHVRPTEYSRYCQVDYSEKVKDDNANLVMFLFGYINQILASRQGTIAPMSEPELIGRLQHLLHLLELTAMFSSSSDYCHFSWLRARNYNTRIFADLDQGVLSWPSISSKLDPTSMMQAIEAIPRPDPKKKFEEVKKKTDDGPPCSKWNSCDESGKCQFEVDNPSKKCSKPHICSYCYATYGYTRTNHKESACNKKKDEAASRQPSR